MTTKHLTNIKFISFTVLLTALNISFNSITAEARSGVNSFESASQTSLWSTVDSNSYSVSDRHQTIPVLQPTIVANSFGGKASWYGPGFHGRLTANGERFNQNAMTAAHPSLRFGTRVQVTNLNNGRSVIVRINDRGPYSGGRVIDLSAAAARSLNMISTGVAPVQVTILGR